MRLTLFVPGLLLPHEILPDITFDLTAPALSLLLGRGRRAELSPHWLEESFGLATLPAAALRKVGAITTEETQNGRSDFGEGSRERSERYAGTKVGAITTEETQNGRSDFGEGSRERSERYAGTKVGAITTEETQNGRSDFGEGSRERSERYAGTKVGAITTEETQNGRSDFGYLCLDPVHFDVRREGIMLADPARLDLTVGEAVELIAAIQPLFAAWGEISASAAERWELHLTRPLALDTRPLAESIDRPVPPGLPGGTDGREWRRLLAEAQTILHAHPLNRQRAAAGRPTVSSLWPWGQGSLPTSLSLGFTTILSDDPVLAGLGKLTGCECHALPECFRQVDGNALAIQPSLRAPATARDALAWRTALQELEHDWLAPAVAALRGGACTELRLIGSSIDDAHQVVAFTATRGALRRFWRRPRPLTELA